MARGAGGSPGVAQRGRQARSQEARQGTQGQGQAGPSSRSWGQPLRGPWDTCPVPRHWNPPLRGPSGLRGSSSAPRACRSASGREAAEGVACSCGCGDLVCRPRQGGRSRGTRRREGGALRSGHARGLGRGGCMRKPAAVWRHWVPGRPAPPSALGTSSAVTRQWVTAIFCTGNTTECPSETKQPGRQRVTAARGGSGARAPHTVPAGLHTWWTNASQVPHGRHRRNRGARRKQCPPLRTDCLCVCPQTYVWKQEPALPSCPAARRGVRRLPRAPCKPALPRGHRGGPLWGPGCSPTPPLP